MIIFPGTGLISATRIDITIGEGRGQALEHD